MLEFCNCERQMRTTSAFSAGMWSRMANCVDVNMRTLMVGLMLMCCTLPRPISCQQQIHQQESQFQAEKQIQERGFSPTVTARCDAGIMTVVISTEQPFHGVVHTRGYRKDPCIVHGNGYYNTTLRISLLATEKDPNYCGVQSTTDRSATIVVRMHRTVELEEDKFYQINCGKTRFKNTRNEISYVSLRFLEGEKKVSELIYGHEYILRVDMSKPDGQYGIKVRNCQAYAINSTEVELIDANGCPRGNFLTPFRFNQTSQAADALLYSMFRFPTSNQVHVQCEVVLCRGGCDEPQCPADGESLPRALPRTRNGSEESVQLMASTSIYVIEPGEHGVSLALIECTEWRFPWLIGLCICLAILLLIMLIVNIFLCSSLTCTCTKTEIVEKEPSEIDDYDPYRVGWAPGSHYGSRTSLNKPGYTSGGSTLNSARSVSNGSDHYAIVHSRPNSRYSQHSGKTPLHPNGNGHHRGPGSTLSNGHYSSRF